MKFNNTKYKALHLHQSNPQYEYRLENELIESSPVEKDVAILVKKILDMSWQCAFPAQKANCVLTCIKKCVTSRAREVVLPLGSLLMRLQLEYCSHLWAPWHRRTLTCGINPEDGHKKGWSTAPMQNSRETSVCLDWKR